MSTIPSSLDRTFLLLNQRARKEEIALEPPASEELIGQFESFIGEGLPVEMVTLYRFCNRFEVSEMFFRMLPLEENMDDMPTIPGAIPFAEIVYIVISGILN